MNSFLKKAIDVGELENVYKVKDRLNKTQLSNTSDLSINQSTSYNQNPNQVIHANHFHSVTMNV